MKKGKNKKIILMIVSFIILVGLIFIFTSKNASNEPEINIEETLATEEITTTQEPETTTEPETTLPPDIVFLGDTYPYDTESLDLSSIENIDTTQLIDGLTAFEYLKEVDFGSNNIPLENKLALVEKYPELFFKWDVELCGVIVNSEAAEADISTHIVEDFEGFKSSLALLPRLTYLDMCDCGLSNEQMEELKEAYPQIKFVWKVTLGLWTIRTDCVAFSTLKDGTITYRLTNEDVQVLKYCTDMVALDLGHNKVTDISFLQYMPNLKILILVDNWAGETADPYIQDLSMLKYVPELMYLEFFVGTVSDISFLQYLPNLVDLNISYNPISDVTYLLNLPNIERLYLEHTLMTDEDYQLLKETYPDAYIVYYGEGSVDQGWREHDRYFAMIDMFHNNYVHELFGGENVSE